MAFITKRAGRRTRTIRTVPVAVESRLLEWEERHLQPIQAKVYRKNLFSDPGAGMEIRLVRYPAGVVNPAHTHPCAHGM